MKYLPGILSFLVFVAIISALKFVLVTWGGFSNNIPNRNLHVTYDSTEYPVYIDPRTGCEYFVSRGLTPRLDKDGKVICNLNNIEPGE